MTTLYRFQIKGKTSKLFVIARSFFSDEAISNAVRLLLIQRLQDVEVKTFKVFKTLKV
jgi:hypothetical protein